jgi:hypothetical protein
MSKSLAELEQRREAIAHAIVQLGDLRPGSITATSGRCGKPNCHCHQRGQPSHGPNFRLTYKVDRRSVTESLSTPTAVRKAEREVAEFRHFQELSREFLETNTAICRLRPVEPAATTEQEKKPRKRSSGK